MNNKEKYRILCQKEPSIPIFSQDWWLDAVCRKDNWDVAIVENNNQIIASLPWYLKKKFLFKYIINPFLTPRLGIWISYPDNQTYTNKLGFEKKTIHSLIDQLPKFDWFNQAFHQNLTNWLPFYWKDFKQTTKYTYTIDNTTDINKLDSIYSITAKRGIRKAKEHVTVKEDVSTHDLITLLKHSDTLQKFDYSGFFPVIHNLIQSSYNRNCGKIIGAIDSNGNIHSILFFVWDENYLTFIIEGNMYDFGNSYAKYLLFDYAIKFGIEKKLKIDFEGSMLRNVEHVNRQFGAKQVPYFEISKVNSFLLKIAFALSKRA